MILLSCHIPFIFFAGKEGLLITLDELDRKSISNALFHKLYATNTAFANENMDTVPPNPNLPMPGTDCSDEVLEVVTPDHRSQTAVLFENVDTNENNPDKLKPSRMTAGLRQTMSMAVKSRLSVMTTEEVNRMAYMDMRAPLYYGGTLGFYAVVIVGSIVIPSVTIVFDFAAAFAISAIAFFFPSIFYIQGNKRFGKGTIGYKRLAYLYFVIGCFNVCLGLTATVFSILGEE